MPSEDFHKAAREVQDKIYQEEFAKLEAKNKRLEEAIKKYGQHGMLCPRRHGDELNPCLCGFDQALKESK